jgi:hypothetical protein
MTESEKAQAQRIDRFKGPILAYMPPDDVMLAWSKFINIDVMGIPYDDYER